MVGWASVSFEVARLDERPDLLLASRDLLVEYLWLPDVWDHVGGTPAALPDWLQAEVDAFPGPASVLLAVVEDEVVGQVELAPVAGTDRRLELRRMYVRPGWQRRGVGRALVDRALESAADLAADTVVLDVLTSRAPAVRLYESAGFRPTEPFRRWPDAFDVRFFERPVPDASNASDPVTRPPS